MSIITEQSQTIRALESRIEELEQERDDLSNAIAEHVEALGHEGNDASALVDALGKLERLLAERDLDDDFVGIAAKVQALVWLDSKLIVHSYTPWHADKAQDCRELLRP